MLSKIDDVKFTNFNDEGWDIEALPQEVRVPSIQLDIPIYLMNAPFNFHASDPINDYMVSLSKEDRMVNKSTAIGQWMNVYNTLSSAGIVYLLPNPKGTKFQDLVFASNAGVAIEDGSGVDKFIVSNFMYEARKAETEIITKFMELNGYEVVVCPHTFEGFADMKYLEEGRYLGGYGIRTDKKAFHWMMDNFDLDIEMVEMTSTALYHMDCVSHPISADEIIVCKDALTDESYQRLKKNFEVFDVSAEFGEFGATSFIRHHNQLIFSSCIHEMNREEDGEDYLIELNKNRFLEDLCAKLGYELVMINISEYHKGGGDISCLALPLNYSSYQQDLI